MSHQWRSYEIFRRNGVVGCIDDVLFETTEINPLSQFCKSLVKSLTTELSGRNGLFCLLGSVDNYLCFAARRKQI